MRANNSKPLMPFEASAQLQMHVTTVKHGNFQQDTGLYQAAETHVVY